MTMSCTRAVTVGRAESSGGLSCARAGVARRAGVAVAKSAPPRAQLSTHAAGTGPLRTGVTRCVFVHYSGWELGGLTDSERR